MFCIIAVVAACQRMSTRDARALCSQILYLSMAGTADRRLRMGCQKAATSEQRAFRFVRHHLLMQIHKKGGGSFTDQ